MAGDSPEPEACDLTPAAAAEPDCGWTVELTQGLRRWARATGRMVVRMGPIMVVAGFASGAAIQILQPQTVDAFLGDSLAGIAIAATIGVLINVPLLFEFPLVALLLLGASDAPAATLLFAAAAGGPITFWGLTGALRWKGIATYALGTWALGMAGGLAATPYGPLPGHRSKAASWLDYDRDGCVDLYVSHLVINTAGTAATRDRLYRNACDGTFTDATTAAGLYQGVTAYRGALLVLGAHLDADLWPDLYVVNVAGDYANRSSHIDQIFRNSDGTYTQVFRDWSWIGDDAQAGMGIDVADVDGNGTWDLYISDLNSGGTPLEDEPWGNVLYLTHPRGSFADNSAERSGAAGDDSWGVNFLDADHDGDEDLFVATMAGSRIDLFFSNEGDGTFRNVAHQAGVRVPDGRGSAIADYDRDGDIDVAVVNQAGSLQLFRNDTDLLGAALQLDLVGTDSNRSAIGAVIKVHAGDSVLMRQVKGGSSGHSQNSLAVHFGLGSAGRADTVEVFWPAGGVVRWHGQPAGQRLRLVEGSACSGVPAVSRCRETPGDRMRPAER